MTIDEMIQVLQAAKEGKQIEKKMKFGKGAQWQRAGTPDWDFDCFIYRVKAEPIVVYAVMSSGDCIDSYWVNKTSAESHLRGRQTKNWLHGARIVKLVEVGE